MFTMASMGKVLEDDPSLVLEEWCYDPRIGGYCRAVKRSDWLVAMLSRPLTAALLTLLCFKPPRRVLSGPLYFENS